jgi:mRNA-degrading endonuclease toxin of MazEF toxin-antitoxin module
MVKPRQGDIYRVRFGRSGEFEPSGKRPAVVIQNNLLNRSNIQTTVVALITSNKKLGRIPGNVESELFDHMHFTTDHGQRTTNYT